ncbi:hypothetical protein [Labrenzia sp. DG1229]|uniref:hypothetical protein n=1 Tax=Labrenzia sp. DG1229 TaxID=681847 RepID=UPI000A8CC6AE|nr:hypothetical protein [Labrenzia sp. DG1229]
MLEIETPANLVDMAELGGAKSRIHWSWLREMWKSGDTWAVRSDGELIALVGVYPVQGTKGWEAWFCLRRELAEHLREFITAMRLTVQAGKYREIVTICGTRAGKVMARRMGFTFAGTCDYGELWTWDLYSAVESATIAAPNSPKRTQKNSSDAA